MNILSSVIHIFRFFNTYNDERNINYSDLIEKGLYFHSNNYSDLIEKGLYFDSINYNYEDYVEIKTVKNTVKSIYIKI